MACYVAFLQGKERAGLERMTGAAGVVAGVLLPIEAVRGSDSAQAKTIPSNSVGVVSVMIPLEPTAIPSRPKLA